MDVLITAPTVEPVSLSEAKLHLRVDGTDDDDLITGLIVAARENCELVTRRALVTQTRELTLNKWPVYRGIHFPVLPLQSVTAITYTPDEGEAVVIDGGDYVVDTVYGRLVLKADAVWPTAALQVVAAIKVRYVAGYGSAVAVPQAIKQAMLLLIGEWYEQREAGVVRDTGPAAALLSPYRNWTVEYS
jgi:uncharacterized phiE125 gp8 family phage protein